MRRVPLSRQRVSFVEAASDPRLLDLHPSPRQLDLLRTIDENRETIACCGRRSGKTRTIAACGLASLLLDPSLDELVAKGEPRRAIVVANSVEQASICTSFAEAMVSHSPLLRAELVAVRQGALEFSRGRLFQALPCSARTIRGYGASFAGMDECAHMLGDVNEGPAVQRRIYAALRPSLATFGERGRLVVSSTPYAPSGDLFSELFAKAEAGEIAAAAFRASTEEMNPSVPAELLEQERQALGETDYQREYQAIFGSGSAQFIERDRIQAVVGRYRELLPEDGRDWVASFDPSFSSDPAALVVVGKHPNEPRQLLVARCQRWLPKKMRRVGLRQSRGERDRAIDEVLDEVARIARHFNARVVSDQHLPAVVEDGLRARGVRSVSIRPWTAAVRTEAFQAVRARIHGETISLPDDEQLLIELGRLRTKLRSGSALVETPRVGDSHSDLAVALAAGVWEHDRSGVGRRASVSIPRGRIPGLSSYDPAEEQLQVLTGLRVSIAPRIHHQRGGTGR